MLGGNGVCNHPCVWAGSNVIADLEQEVAERESPQIAGAVQTRDRKHSESAAQSEPGTAIGKSPRSRLVNSSEYAGAEHGPDRPRSENQAPSGIFLPIRNKVRNLIRQQDQKDDKPLVAGGKPVSGKPKVEWKGSLVTGWVH